MSIPNSRLKIKSQAKRVGKTLLEAIILAGILGACFIIGRLSAVSVKESKPVTVVYPPMVSNRVALYKDPDKDSADSETVDGEGSDTPAVASEPALWAYAASKPGKTYYPKDCKSLGRIKPENRVYFTSEEQAQTAGYTLSAACAN